ncbi:unnamed protein product [Rangifer tarandus platyrhynchus]|uniref:Uncharacterized protein n=2 Tax=Rangifer tarandus platyrhynchus TaxID=3082113 RepID=A0ACB0F836_RANTA|nr:unnamed protein product [Rangifer tarandus platyrhynchus]CAI9709262.1 unnamed protein product [Rangifer tarandus platyrhynchus]
MRLRREDSPSETRENEAESRELERVPKTGFLGLLINLYEFENEHMFSGFPWNPESNANVSEACKPNLSGSQPKETLPWLEGTRDDVRGHSWLSQLEEGRVLASRGRRSNILPYVLRRTGLLHIQELSSPKSSSVEAEKPHSLDWLPASLPNCI